MFIVIQMISAQTLPQSQLRRNSNQAHIIGRTVKLDQDEGEIVSNDEHLSQ
jgi:hypothetical protein